MTMALATLQFKKDLIVRWAPNAAQPAAFSNFCGATGGTLRISNAIQETTNSDCQDWSKPPVTEAAYGAQTATLSLTANFAVENRDKLLRWALDQLLIPLQVQVVGAAVGEIEYLDGIGMLPSLDIGGIANQAGDVLTTSLDIRFKAGVKPMVKT